jgi:hypothetical protein
LRFTQSQICIPSTIMVQIILQSPVDFVCQCVYTTGCSIYNLRQRSQKGRKALRQAPRGNRDSGGAQGPKRETAPETRRDKKEATEFLLAFLFSHRLLPLSAHLPLPLSIILFHHSPPTPHPPPPLPGKFLAPGGARPIDRRRVPPGGRLLCRGEAGEIPIRAGGGGRAVFCSGGGFSLGFLTECGCPVSGFRGLLRTQGRRGGDPPTRRPALPRRPCRATSTATRAQVSPRYPLSPVPLPMSVF